MSSNSEKKQINLDHLSGDDWVKVVSSPTPIKYITAGQKLMLQKTEEINKKKKRDQRKKRSFWKVFVLLIKKAWKNY